MKSVIFILVLISGSLCQDVIYKNVCRTLVETFDCSTGFKSKKICATDGSIYETECDFSIAHCRNYKLEVDKTNSCDGSSVVSGSIGMVHQSSLTTAGQGLGQSSTSGQGPSSTASMTMAHTNQGHTTTRSITTPMSTTTMTTTTTTTAIPTTLNAICQVLVAASCPSDKSEICGTDKETYDNMCFYEKAKCVKPILNVDHNGPCQLNAVDIICKTVEDKACPAETEIVCGNDGKTYQNLCEFDKGKCRNPTLKLAGLGKC